MESILLQESILAIVFSNFGNRAANSVTGDFIRSCGRRTQQVLVVQNCPRFDDLSSHVSKNYITVWPMRCGSPFTIDWNVPPPPQTQGVSINAPTGWWHIILNFVFLPSAKHSSQYSLLVHNSSSRLNYFQIL
jgi:hypothetical protein